MRNFFPRLLGTVALLAAVVGSPALRADDLDVLLTQPPSGSLTSEDAARRIEMLRAFIASHPDRALDIEAYLIPFVRATQPPLAEPTPPPAPPPAKAKPLLLIRQSDGTGTAMKATSFRRQGAVILVYEANGGHAVLQAATVTGELPWYSEKELASGAVDLNELAARYESFAKAMPELRPALAPESKRLRGLSQARDQAESARRDALLARLKEATSAVYDPGADYTSAALAQLLLDAEKARGEIPGEAAKIDQWAAPFRAHFAKLLGGQSFIKGAWVSNEELARQAREKRQAAFSKTLDYRIGSEPFPDGAVRALATLPLAAGALVFAAGAVLLVAGRRRGSLAGAGAALLALAPLALAALFFLATRNPPLLPAAIAMADEQSILDALSQAAGMDEEPAGAQKISERELNSFLARHLRLAPSAGADARQALIIRLLPGRLVVFEMIRSLGLSWIVRLDLRFQPAGSQPRLVLTGAKIGALDCPPKFAAELWKNLEPQFAQILSASRIAAKFSVQSPGDGTIELEPIAKAGESPAAAPAL